jgi:hypothetical protein
MSGLVTISVVGAKATDHRAPVRVCHGDLHGKAGGNHAEKRNNEGLDIAEAEVLHPEDEEHVERGQNDADLERNVKQEIEADRRSDHFGKVRRADRNSASTQSGHEM